MGNLHYNEVNDIHGQVSFIMVHGFCYCEAIHLSMGEIYQGVHVPIRMKHLYSCEIWQDITLTCM